MPDPDIALITRRAEAAAAHGRDSGLMFVGD
jgi:hypothetical protein